MGNQPNASNPRFQVFTTSHTRSYIPGQRSYSAIHRNMTRHGNQNHRTSSSPQFTPNSRPTHTVSTIQHNSNSTGSPPPHNASRTRSHPAKLLVKERYSHPKQASCPSKTTPSNPPSTSHPSPSLIPIPHHHSPTHVLTTSPHLIP